MREALSNAAADFDIVPEASDQVTPSDLTPNSAEIVAINSWPQLNININERMVFPGNRLATPRNQLSWLFRSVTEAVMLQVPEKADEIGTHYEALSKHEQLRAYFFKLPYARTPTIERISRWERDQVGDVAERRWKELKIVRHPLVQSWERVDSINNLRRIANSGELRHNQKELIDMSALDTMAIDLLLAFDADYLKNLPTENTKAKITEQ
jgi:hypothetical protein